MKEARTAAVCCQCACHPCLRHIQRTSCHILLAVDYRRSRPVGPGLRRHMRKLRGAHMLAVQLAGSSRLSSLVDSSLVNSVLLQDEDAEAKAQRLAKHLGLQRAEEAAAEAAEEEEEAARQRQQDAGAAQHAAAAGVAAAAHAGRGSVAVTDGPIAIDLPASSGKRRGGRGGAAGEAAAVAQQGGAQQAEAGRQQQGGLPHQDWLFGNGKAAAAGGKKGGAAAAAAGGVSIGPASGAAGERAQSGAPPPAQAAQQADGGVAPQPGFVKSKSFQGARPGYVFKKGPQGEPSQLLDLAAAGLLAAHLAGRAAATLPRRHVCC